MLCEFFLPGYGTLAPSTAASQIIFIFYALIGIPLAFMLLAHIGSIINKFIQASLRPVKRKWGTAVSGAISVAILFLVTLLFCILIPGAVFTTIETWNYRESVYFTVVSLTSVGFGEFVPAQAGSSSGVFIAAYKIISTAWLWTGLALVSAVLTEFQNLFEAVWNLYRTMKKIAEKRELIIPLYKEIPENLDTVQEISLGNSSFKTSVHNGNNDVEEANKFNCVTDTAKL